MRLRARILFTVLAILHSRGAIAQAHSAEPSVVGTWRGASRCLVRPSPCNDETVVYRITRAGAGDSLSMDARHVALHLARR